jgi:hypothetical protein
LTRADWLNAAQAALAGLQFINVGLVSVHPNPIITLTVGGMLAAGTYFVHGLALNTMPPGPKQ